MKTKTFKTLFNPQDYTFHYVINTFFLIFINYFKFFAQFQQVPWRDLFRTLKRLKTSSRNSMGQVYIKNNKYILMFLFKLFLFLNVEATE